MAEEIRAYLTLFEIRQEDAVDASGQKPGQVCLAHAERQLADILAVADQDIEGVEHNLFVMLARVQTVEV